MHVGCCSTSNSPAALVFLRFSKISQHPASMDHAILHGKPLGNPLFHFIVGEVSPTIWSCYANLNHISLLISLAIDSLYGLQTQKNLHLHGQMSGWFRHCNRSRRDILSRDFREIGCKSRIDLTRCESVSRTWKGSEIFKVFGVKGMPPIVARDFIWISRSSNFSCVV